MSLSLPRPPTDLATLLGGRSLNSVGNSSGKSVVDVLDLPARPAGKSLVLAVEDKKMAALLVAMGEPVEVVAKKLSLDQQAVEDYVKTKAGTDVIIKMQTALFPDPAARIKKCAHMAIDATLKLLLQGKTEAVVAKVAGDILDRSMGKAVQINENRNINIDVADMAAADKALAAQMERLNKLEETQRRLLAAKNVTPAAAGRPQTSQRSSQ